jgi:ABC-type sugar transport system ATPase subunit
MIEVRELAIKAGEFSLTDVSFSVASGQYAVLMGRTGCGKTSILEAICGLRRVASGCILIDQLDITHWSPADRGVGYVPQDLALFPTLTVKQHLQFALRIRKWPRGKIEERTVELARVLGIEHLLERSVQGLSGGEAQRTALGRALSFKPSVLLLDEPLSALDEATRQEMYQLLKTVKEATGVTTLHVTHSRDEAETLADIHLTIADGRVQE